MGKTNGLYACKRVLSVVLALAVLLLALPAMSFTARAASTFSGGIGTKEDPYLISTKEDLVQLANDVNNNITTYENIFFRMTTDIDLLNDPWAPIGSSSTNNNRRDRNFSGTFDGGGHEIKGLNVTDRSFAGLFGAISKGTVMNLTVSGSVSGGTLYSGGIVAYNNLGTIDNCVNKCSVASTERTANFNNYIGGIAGNNAGGSIKNCRNEGTITGTSHEVGGIAGGSSNSDIYPSVIENCWNKGTVSIQAQYDGYYVGGIVGLMDGKSNSEATSYVKNCYNVANISDKGPGEGVVGGIAGHNNRGVIENCYNIGGLSGIINSVVGGIVGSIKTSGDDTVEVTGCYYLDTADNGYGEETGDNTIIDITKVTSDQLKEESTFKGWDFDKTWNMRSSLGRPVLLTLTSELLFEGSGTENDPYVIDTAGTLQAFAQMVNNGSDFEDKFIELANDIDLLEAGVCGADIGSWTPIGKDKAFKGTFDGKGHKILNLYIDDGSEDNAGLFGINNGTIKNLTVTGTVTGGRYAGGIVGTNKPNGRIESCRNACDVTGSSEVGGIAGFNEGGAINNCYNTGDIGGNSEVGGIAGNNDHGTVKNSYNIGDISGSTNVGGIAGSDNVGTVENCYYLGDEEDGSGIGTPKTEDEFNSGEVAFLLQGEQEKQVWGQQLTGDDKDDYPILTGDADTKVVKFPYDCTDKDGSDLTVYTNPPETTADLPAGTTVKLGDAEVTVTDGGTVESKEGGKMFFPEGSVAKKNGKTLNAPEGGGVYDPVTGTWENGSLDDQTGDNDDQTGDNDDPTGDNDDPTGDNDDPTDGNDSGNVNIDSSSGANAPSASMDKETSDKLKAEIIAKLTEEEKAALENGDDLNVILKVDNADNTVSAEDKQATKAVLTNTGYTVGQYLNIDLIKLINGQQVDKITALNTPIKVAVEIPKALKSSGRTYAVVRVHNGVSEILEDMDNDPNTITILTDKFSTYTIVYKNAVVDDDDDDDDVIINSKPNNSGTDSSGTKNPYTGNGISGVAAMVLACAAGTAAVVIKKRRTK